MRKARTRKRGPAKGSKRLDRKRSPFGHRLMKARKLRGLTQKELGDKVGLSIRMISYYESDTQGPPVAVVIELAKALNVTVSYLFGESPLKITRDELDPALKKRIEDLERLPRSDQRTAFKVIDSLAEKQQLETKLKSKQPE